MLRNAAQGGSSRNGLYSRWASGRTELRTLQQRLLPGTAGFCLSLTGCVPLCVCVCVWAHVVTGLFVVLSNISVLDFQLPTLV